MRVISILLVLAGTSACTPRFEWPQADTVVSGVHVIDPVEGTVRSDRMVVIRSGEVLAVVPSATANLPDSVHHIEAGGAFATPGLWDAHVHALGDTESALDRILPAFIAHGVTHIRDMGANLDRLRAVRAALAEDPERLAPRILASGPLLVEQELQWYGDLQRAVGGPGGPEAAVAELQAGGVDFLKVYSGLSAPSHEALVSVAQRAGLRMDGHVPDAVGLPGVIEAGQRTIEHLDPSSFLSCRGGTGGSFGNFLDVRFGQGLAAYISLAGDFWSGMDWTECASALDAFAARGGALTPTLSMEVRDRARIAPEALAALDPGARQWCEQGLAELDEVDPGVRERYHQALFAALRSVERRGVTLLAGTDSPNHCNAPGISLAGELERLAEAGLSPLAVLQSATTSPRRVLGAVDSGLEPGQQADFVLFANNPLEDPSTYRAPVGVYVRRQWLDRNRLEAMRADLADPPD